MYRRLRDLREDHDLTQKQIAKILSFTNSAYAKIERGEHTLTADVLVTLSNFYDVSTDYRKRVITRYLSFMDLLLYTISKVKLLEDILMPQPIVPVEIPQSRRFDSKKRNDILLKIRIGKLELSFFQSLNLEMIEQLLDKVLLYDNSSI